MRKLCTIDWQFQGSWNRRGFSLLKSAQACRSTFQKLWRPENFRRHADYGESSHSAHIRKFVRQFVPELEQLDGELGMDVDVSGTDRSSDL